MTRAVSFARALGRLAAGADLLVTKPCRNGHASSIERGAKQTALHDQRAGPLVDRRAAETAHDVASARPAVGLDPQPQIDDPAPRPAVPDRRWIVAASDPANQRNWNRDSATAARAIPARAPARSGADPARAGSRPAHI